MDEETIVKIIALLSFVGLILLLRGTRHRAKILQHLWIPQGTKIVTSKNILRIIYFSVACACLLAIFAVAHTQKSETIRTAHITLLVDVSRSQAAERPLGTDNRIERNKKIIQGICDEYPDIHTSLYAFTHIARSHAYFSESAGNKDNCGYIKKILENVLTIESVSKTGSNIAAALLASSASFPPEAESRILILFTDGEYTNPDKEFVQALSGIKRNNILLLVVGIGEEGGAYIPIYNENSGELIDVERGVSGKKIITALRSETLRAIAEETNGKYFPESEQNKLFNEIEANLVDVEEKLENFYSTWGLLFFGGFILSSFLFSRSVA